MLYLSQRDSRWSPIKLGSSSLTVGRYGCTTTCISMLTSYFGMVILPDAIAKREANYTKEGLIVWNNLFFPSMKFVWREYTRNDQRIEESLKDPNKAVILQVSNGAHWVVAIGKSLFGYGKDYICVDPWTGKKCKVLATYKNITGAAYFAKK